MRLLRKILSSFQVHEGDAVIQPAGAVARLYLPPPTMRETPVLSMSFTDGQGRGIRLDRVLQGDLQRLSDSGDRSFFQGFGEKCSIKIMVYIYTLSVLKSVPHTDTALAP